VSIRLRLLLLVFACCVAACISTPDPVPAHAVDLSGNWKLNAALSDNPEHMLAERQREDNEQYMKRRRQWEKMYPPDAPPPIDVDAGGASHQSGPSPSRRASIKRHQENLHKMLGISDTLTIRQQGGTLDFVSAVDARRVVAGTHTQVSLPEGELADSRVGWDGQWFVIDRNVNRGPHVVEKFRLVPKTDQLEYEMKWSGESELAGMKVHRVFDRSTQAPPPADPAAGPNR
jgi:hypothetical protein